MTKKIHLINFLIFIPFMVQAQHVKAPDNLTAILDSINSKILLSWDASVDKVTGYNLFVKKENDSKYFMWGKAGLIWDTNYDFQVSQKFGNIYSFKVCAVQNFPEVVRSEFSNIATIKVSSSYLPLVGLSELKVKKNVLEISWIYDIVIPDLKGFIIILNGREILVDKESREYTVSDMKPGKHVVQILAYSESGLKSNLSLKKFISIK